MKTCGGLAARVWVRQEPISIAHIHARASLEELLTDFRDFLRTRGLSEWGKDDAYVRRLKTLNRTPNANYETFRKAVENPDPAIRANALIDLIKVTNYLLDQQLRRLEKDFVEQGGLREAMTRARLEHRAKQRPRQP